MKPATDLKRSIMTKTSNASAKDISIRCDLAADLILKDKGK